MKKWFTELIKKFKSLFKRSEKPAEAVTPPVEVSTTPPPALTVVEPPKPADMVLVGKPGNQVLVSRGTLSFLGVDPDGPLPDAPVQGSGEQRDLRPLDDIDWNSPMYAGMSEPKKVFHVKPPVGWKGLLEIDIAGTPYYGRVADYHRIIVNGRAVATTNPLGVIIRTDSEKYLFDFPYEQGFSFEVEAYREVSPGNFVPSVTSLHVQVRHTP